jgi:UDP-N-acetyl-D-mannosaminuronic acid transferase (WecB/TagA/CpsF family)
MPVTDTYKRKIKKNGIFFKNKLILSGNGVPKQELWNEGNPLLIDGTFEEKMDPSLRSG